MPNTDVRKYGETVLEQGRAALDEARKPLFAAVGATNLAFDQLRTQLRDLPAETQEQLRKLQDRAGTLDRAKVRKTVEEYAEQARDTYGTLARRGEQVVRQLRRDPRVRNAFAETEELVERTEEAVTGRPAKPTRTTPTRTSTTRTTPTRTSTTRTTPTRTSTTATKAPARKTTARKTTPKS
jgi:heparin binding hemagglutinin HbhA